ncbi:MAG: HDOD domain-containing protein, partial [Ruminiclostridium sp.]|nr:HDOD domain-containing protein [Ruminiclostridium sp.]
MSFLVSKQPMFNPQGVTDAYELLYCFASYSDEQNEPTDEEIEEAKEYLRANFDCIFNNKIAYVRFSHRLLQANFHEMFMKDKLIIEVTAEMLTDPSTLQKCMQLKRLGYSIAFSDLLYSEDTIELFNFADVVRFNINEDADEIIATVKKCHEKGKLAMADNVETQDEFDFARDTGIDYIRGHFFAKPVLETKRSGGPMIKTFLQILALLYSPEPNIEYISAIISTDPVLTIKLLKVINQLCADRGNTVSTVHQALVLLGIDRLKEWIYLVGLQRLNRNSPAEILRLALF